MDTRARNWFLTINNYSIEELEFAKNYTAVYKLIGQETCPTTGTPHIHIYLELAYQKTFRKMKKEYPRANIKVALGSAHDNFRYLSKEKLLLEEGIPKQQGQRKDIEQVRDLIHDGNNMREILMVASSIQTIRMAEIHLKYFERKRNWKPVVKWYYGETGTGKSKRAFDESEDPYVCLDTIKWWEGYDQHKHVIIDDMRGDFCKFHQLLKLLDRYEYKIECKGGSRQFLAEQIIITSCYTPDQMFGNKTDEDLQQLHRRIDILEEIIYKNNIYAI